MQCDYKRSYFDESRQDKHKYTNDWTVLNMSSE